MKKLKTGPVNCNAFAQKPGVRSHDLTKAHLLKWYTSGILIVVKMIKAKLAHATLMLNHLIFS